MANVLLIDDEDLVRRPLRRMLETAGHNVAEAPDGETGLLMFEEAGFDVVITDIVMPHKGGMETIMELRHSHPDAEIIAMSGKIPTDSTPVRLLAEQFGVRRVLHKPFSKDELLEAVAASLAERPQAGLADDLNQETPGAQC